MSVKKYFLSGGLPRATILYVNAALTAFKARSDGVIKTLSPIVAECPSIVINRDNVDKYSSVCGFTPSDHVPITYPFTLSFPLQVMFPS